MVYLISENWWPPEKSEEVGKLTLEIFQKFPGDLSIVKPIVQAAIWPDKDGMHSISVSSIEPGKVKEAMDIAYNQELFMSKGIEGWRFKLHIAYDNSEAMPLVGLQAPQL